MLKFLYALTAGVLTATAALATPSQCALGTLTAHYADSSTASWSDCTGAWDGNLAPTSSAAIATIISLEFGLSPAVLVGKTGDATNPWTSDPGSVASGTLNFASPWGGRFVVGLHAGDQDAPVYPGVPVGSGGDFSLYLFDGSVHGGVVAIDFDTRGVSVNRNGDGRNLSHAALYGGSLVPIPQSGSVPEPGQLALLSLAFGAAAGLSRRHARKG